ncbi:MAG: hypothetical protein A3D92_13055 [Bacteroidetes bacterium RIFCSPHIGHO2_02_FULL_44_7]|nr:MAG: hypothetical protein A3D92_13055 [Bacteroidetes bacterium RIFCSPHIGHO2_02_FULL_44_7]
MCLKEWPNEVLEVLKYQLSADAKLRLWAVEAKDEKTTLETSHEIRKKRPVLEKLAAHAK